SDRAAYYILSTHSFLDSGAVRQSIHEPEDAYRVVQGFVDLPQRAVLLFLIWREPFVNSVGLKSVNGSVRPWIAGAFSRVPSAFSSAGRSNRPTTRRIDSSGPSPNQVWYDSITFRAWTPCRTSCARRADTSLRKRISPLKASVR